MMDARFIGLLLGMGYFAIGLFIAGVFMHNESVNSVMIVTFLWPFLAIACAIFGPLFLAYWLGTKVNDAIEKRKNRGDK